ncbi:hypothetical protein HAX54_020082, partial [Datura stramonium]|nr:hypothetical protein [Datura stramonium]
EKASSHCLEPVFHRRFADRDRQLVDESLVPLELTCVLPSVGNSSAFRGSSSAFCRCLA